MKKKISILLTAAISFMLAACNLGPQNTAENNASSDGANPVSAESPSADGASSDKVSNKKTKISFALWDEVQKPVFDEIISAFKREHPDIDVDLVLTPWSQYWTKLDAAMGANTAADVFWMNTFLPKYADAGVLEPLDSYIEKDGVDLNQYVNVMKESLSYNDVQYCLPKGFDTVQVFYNKALFEKYGIEEPEEGWTWEDMVSMAASLREKIEAGGADEYPILMELDPQPSYFNFILQSGGFILKDKKAGFDQEGTIQAYRDVLALMEKGLMPDVQVLSDTKGTDLFLSQKGAMLFMGSWKISVLDKASFAEQIGVVPMPAKKNGNQSVIGGLGYAMNANSKNKDAAWELIKFLAGEEANKMQAEAGIDIPALISAQQYYKTEHLDTAVIMESVKTGFPFPTSLSVADWLPAVMENSSRIFSKELSPEEGCDAIQNIMQDALDHE